MTARRWFSRSPRHPQVHLLARLQVVRSAIADLSRIVLAPPGRIRPETPPGRFLSFVPKPLPGVGRVVTRSLSPASHQVGPLTGHQCNSRRPPKGCYAARPRGVARVVPSVSGSRPRGAYDARGGVVPSDPPLSSPRRRTRWATGVRARPPPWPRPRQPPRGRTCRIHHLRGPGVAATRTSP